jgi:hypothetical protein
MYGFNMFSLFSTLFPIVFIFVFGIIIFTFVKGIGEWSSNNKQPVISVVAKVVGKRGHTTSNHNHDTHIHSSSSTSYYATFEVESGDRIEFHISAAEFGMIAEGDIGKLTFQGTRYHSFERVINK